jgi:hypothetical protein
VFGSKLHTLVKMIAFWDREMCILIEVDHRFRGVYCLHHCGTDGGGSRHLRNISLLRCHSTVSQKAIIFVFSAVKTWNLTFFGDFISSKYLSVYVHYELQAILQYLG